MKRWLKIIAPLMLMALFVLIMTGDWYFKKPHSERDDVALYISQVREAVLADDWAKAQADLQQLQNAWQIIIRRVQFSVERDEIRLLTSSLARVGGALTAQDAAGALIELAEAEEHWHDLGQ